MILFKDDYHDMKGILQSQLEFISVHIADTCKSVLEGSFIRSFSETYQFLKTYEIKNTILLKMLDLASISAAETPYDSFRYIMAILGPEQFYSEEYRVIPSSPLSQIMLTEEWNEKPKRYAAMYIFGLCLSIFLQKMSKNLKNEKESEILHVIQIISSQINDCMLDKGSETFKIFELLIPHLSHAAALLSYHADPAPQYYSLASTCTVQKNIEDSIHITTAILYSEMKIANKKVEIDDNFNVIVSYSHKLYQDCIQNSKNIEICAKFLYNVFGQLLPHCKEAQTLPIFRDTFTLSLTQINAPQHKYSMMLATILSDYINGNIEWIYTSQLSTIEKISLISLHLRGRKFLPEPIMEEMLIEWEPYDNCETDAALALNFVAKHLDEICENSEILRIFLIQLSLVSVEFFITVIDSIFEIRMSCMETFFKIATFFLARSEYKTANDILKKFVITDDLMEYVHVLHLPPKPTDFNATYQTISLFDTFFEATAETEITPNWIFDSLFNHIQLTSGTLPASNTARGAVGSWTKQLGRSVQLPFTFNETRITHQASKLGSESVAFWLVAYFMAIMAYSSNKDVLSLMTTMTTCGYADLGNLAQWGMEYVMHINPSATSAIIDSITEMYTDPKYLFHSTLCLSVTMLSVLIPRAKVELSEETKKRIELLIVLGLCEPSWESREHAVNLMKATAGICELSDFYLENEPIISKSGMKNALFCFKIEPQNSASDRLENLSFGSAAAGSDTLLYMFYIASFAYLLHEKKPEVFERMMDTKEYSITILNPADNPVGYLIAYSMMAPKGMSAEEIINVFTLSLKTNPLFPMAVFSYSSEELSDAIFAESNENFRKFILTAASILYRNVQNEEYATKQAQALSPGLQLLYNSFLDSIRSNLEPRDNGLEPLGLGYMLMIKSFHIIFKRIGALYNKPPGGRYGLALRIDPKFAHYCDSKKSFETWYLLSSTKSVFQGEASKAFAEWAFFGTIGSEEVLAVAYSLNGQKLATNLLSKNFSILLPLYTKMAATLVAPLFAVCRQFNPIYHSDDSMTDEIAKYFCPLLTVGFSALSLGNNVQRESGFNMLLCLCSGTYSIHHTKEETEQLVEEIESMRQGLAGAFADVEYNLPLLSELLAKRFRPAAEMLTHTIFELEGEINTKEAQPKKQSVLNPSKKGQIVRAKSSTKLKKVENYSSIELLISLLHPWLKFESLDKGRVVIESCPKELRCYNLYSFLHALFSLKCAKPLSSSVAAIIAKMANVSEENAIITFSHILRIRSNDQQMTVQAHSALSLVLAISPSAIFDQMMKMTTVEAWFALRAKSQSQQKKSPIKYKKTVSMMMDVFSELILEKSDSVMSVLHKLLAFAIVTFTYFKREAGQLMVAIAPVLKEQGKKKTPVEITASHLAEMCAKNMVAFRRPETLLKAFSVFSQKEMKEVTQILLQWGLCCYDFTISVPALTLLCILKPELGEKETKAVCRALYTLSNSMHERTLSNQQHRGFNAFIDAATFKEQDMLVVICISKLLALLNGNRDMEVFKVFSSFLVCTDSDYSPIYSAALENVAMAIKCKEIAPMLPFKNGILGLVANVADGNSLRIVKKILVSCYVHRFPWVKENMAFVEFCLGPLVWSTRRDKERLEELHEAAVGGLLHSLSKGDTDRSIIDFHWKACSELNNKELAAAANLFSKEVKYGEPSEAQAAYLLLSKMVDGDQLGTKCPAVSAAVLQAVVNHVDTLEDAVTTFLKSATLGGYSQIAMMQAPSRGRITFPEIGSGSVQEEKWRYKPGVFEDPGQFPPLFAENFGNVGDFIDLSESIEPFNTWNEMSKDDESLAKCSDTASLVNFL